MKSLRYYLPYMLCPLAFFGLLGSVQYLILRHAYSIEEQPFVASHQPLPSVAAKSRRLPASLIID